MWISLIGKVGHYVIIGELVIDRFMPEARSNTGIRASANRKHPNQSTGT